jgi:putative membrane protein
MLSITGINAQPANPDNIEAPKVDRGKDLLFINEATSAGLMEVQLGKMAQQKGVSQQVKDFGKLMEKEHGDANKKLMAITDKLGVPVRSGMMDKHQEHIKDLSEKSGASFDQAYIDSMVKDHKDDIEAFEKAEEEVSETELKQWIASTLPALKQHAIKAESIKEQVK